MRAYLDKTTMKGVLLMLALGLAVGLVNNLTAGPTRQIEWGRKYPPKGEPNCPQTLPGEGQGEASGAGAATPETTTGIAVVATEPELAAASMAMPEHASAEPVAPVAAPAAVALAAVAPAAVAPTPTAPSASVAASAPAAASVAPPTPRAAVEIPPLPPGKFWLELTPEQVDALFERGALFVDARMTSQYADGHVAGAVTIPIWEAGADSKVAQLPFDVEGDMSKPIVVYCGGGDCEDSHNLGTMITQAGHLAVYVYKDGYPDWLKRGRPIRKGAQR